MRPGDPFPAFDLPGVDGGRISSADVLGRRPLLVYSMWETLTAAGPVALRDVARQAPPMWVFGRLGGVFRPLPPLGRGLAAAAVMAAGGGVSLAAWRGRPGRSRPR